MSRDSSRTYIHLHSSRHADIFEEFSTPPAGPHLNAGDETQYGSSTAAAAAAAAAAIAASQQQGSGAEGGTMGSALVAAGTTSHIPAEDIFVPPQHLPVNPEDEDDVVPDQHAAFGITRAMAARDARDRAWRDFDGLADLVAGSNLNQSNIHRPRPLAGEGPAATVDRAGSMPSS